MLPLVLVNPRAALGRTGRRLADLDRLIRRHLGPVDLATPESAGDTARLAEQSARDGRPALIAAGGDGTLNAVACGLGSALATGGRLPPLALFSAGSGGDFCRALGLRPGDPASLAALAAGRFRRIDMGRIDLDGQAPRHFLSVANAGLSARVVAATARSALPGLIGPRLAYVPLVLRELARERGTRLCLQAETGQRIEGRFILASVANSAFFAAGMPIAPQARPDDGLLDVVLIRHGAGIRPWDLGRLRRGDHLTHPAVIHLRCATLTLAAPEDPGAVCDADGEVMGPLPARLSCLAEALTLALP